MEMKPIVLANVQIEESYKSPPRKFGYELITTITNLIHFVKGFMNFHFISFQNHLP